MCKSVIVSLVSPQFERKKNVQILTSRVTYLTNLTVLLKTGEKLDQFYLNCIIL